MDNLFHYRSKEDKFIRLFDYDRGSLEFTCQNRSLSTMVYG